MPINYCIKHKFYVLIAICIQTFLSAYLMTDGVFDFLRPHEYSLVFADMWDHLKNAQLNASPEIISQEGFLIYGETFAYQLPLPALVRGFLSLFSLENSAIISALLANLIFTISSYLLWTQICPQCQKTAAKSGYYFYAYYLILCSPSLILLTYPRIFTEVVLWALALFLTSVFLSTKLTNDKKFTLLPIFAFCCGLTLFTRPTFALASTILFLATLYSLVGMGKKVFKCDWNRLYLSVVIFAAFLICLGFYNFAKWGSPIEFYPINNYIMFDDTNLMDEFIRSGGANQLNRIPQAFAYYLFPSLENLNSSFPILRLSHPNFFQSLGIFTYDEPAIPISLSLPAYVIFATLGLYVISKAVLTRNIRGINIRLLMPGLIGALVLIPPILTLHAKALRYQAELIPLILLLSNYFAAKTIYQIGSLLEQQKLSAQFRILANRCFVAIASATLLGSIFMAIQSPLLQNTLINKASISSYIDSDQFISFSRPLKKGVSGIPYANSGWSEPEAWGIWSSGSQSTLLFPPLKTNNPQKLILQVRALIDNQSPHQRVSIWINGIFSQDVTLKSSDDNQITIPLNNPLFEIRQKNLLEKYIFGRPVHSEPLRITLYYKDAHAPSFSSSNDKRMLAIGLISARFNSD